jgi:hypothetical protein
MTKVIPGVPTELVFTETQADILLHRLENFTDAGFCSEVFEEDIDPDLAAEYATEVVNLIRQKIYALPITSEVSLEVLADALEGSTYFGNADAAVEDEEISRQKVSAQRKSAWQAAEKIGKLLGRHIVPSLE